MRTALDIADDVLVAVKELAQHEKKPLGEVVCDLARQGLAQKAVADRTPDDSQVPQTVCASQQLASYGIQPLAARGVMVDTELIDSLRDEEPV